MELNITKTGGIGKLNILLYGQPGTGKTRFIGSTYPKFKVLIASAESGLLSLNNVLDKDGKPVKFDKYDIRKFEDIEDVYKFMQFGKHDFDCVALDSGTEIQKVCMEYILRKESREKAQQADWGTLGDKMGRLIRSFRDGSHNFIMTALEEEVKNNDGSSRVMPMFQGKLQQMAAGYFDEVFYSFVKEDKDANDKPFQKYLLLTRNNGKYIGKDRSDKLSTVVEPDFCKIHEAIYKGEK